ncbi:hypothetical protein MMC07_002589 [Pseudocyphellaria aurata]|nr:hypothetical protein [Pseudocyphellaria aurata]
MPSTTSQSPKRRYELSGADDGEVVSPSRKKNKVGGLDITVLSKSSDSVREAVRNTATRKAKALPNRRSSKSAKPSFSSFDSNPTRADAARAPTTCNTTRASVSIIPNPINPGLPQSMSLNAAISITIQHPNPEIAHLSTSIRYRYPTQEFIIYQDTAEEEFDNLLSHSTLSLNISADESRSTNPNSRGRNVPPPDSFVTAGTRNMTPTERARIPLGELDVTRFYDGVEAEEL